MFDVTVLYEINKKKAVVAYTTILYISKINFIGISLSVDA